MLLQSYYRFFDFLSELVLRTKKVKVTLHSFICEAWYKYADIRH